jgi:lysophospholipase L1-like esterase
MRLALKVTGKDDVINILSALKNESRLMPGFAFNHLAAMTTPTSSPSGSTNYQKWTSEPENMPDVLRYGNNLCRDIFTPTGRAYVVNSIKLYGSLDYTAQAYIRREVLNSSSGNNGVIGLDGMISGRVTYQSNPNGGEVQLLENPIVLPCGDAISISYFRDRSSQDSEVTPVTKTKGMRWMIDFDGYDITNDFNYSAEKTMLVIGDSIGGVTSDLGSIMVNKQPDNSYIGLWPFIIRNQFKEQGEDIRLVNIAQGGTTSNQWDWWIKQGRIDNIKSEILFINLGMNDAADDSALATIRQNLKNICARFFLINPNSSIVINNITQSNGLNATRANNYRAEIRAAVTDEAANGKKVYLADTDDAYSLTNNTPFVATEQLSGVWIHPNTTIGQPAMAVKIWGVCKDLLG